MTRRIITECPACTTRFQVTDGQLKIANSKVRCGACLEVFNAELYSASPAVTDSDTAPDKGSAIQSTTNIPNRASDQDLADKDPLFDQIQVAEFIAPQTRQSRIVDKRYPSSHEQEEALVEQSTRATDITDPLATEPTGQTSTADTVTDHTDVEPQLDLDKPIQEYITQPLTVNPEETDEAALTLSDQLTDEINLEQITNKPVVFSPPEHAAKTQKKNAKPGNTLGSVANPTTGALKKAPPFTAVRAEPVMIRATAQPSGLSGWWAFSCLIAALLLASQYLWFNRATLARQPDLASLYEIVCQEIECNLPVRQDIGSINTAKLVVQEHREYQGALSVNLLLENQATYTQPYPAIILSFADRKGIAISQRIFQPREYLHESIVDLTSMPVNQTLQISLDILDPGRRAVSYQAELRPASL
ncbi:MAG: DUF3426 domain-containing protein [Amphritea sp.]